MLKKLIYIWFNRLNRQAREFEVKKKLKKMNISDTVNVYNSDIFGNVFIGDYTYIAPNSVLSSGKKSKITIGKHCAIGRCVHIMAKGHDLVYPTSDEKHIEHKHVDADIYIGNYVWIGDNVFIKHGITIADYAVVGANSVVTKDIKPFEIVAGVPAKHIRFNIEHNRYGE